MKKMVCEICGSQTIRKENGVFVCQECGTEYSLEDAKHLLQEIAVSSKPDTSNAAIASPKSQDLDKIYLWINYLKPLHELNKFLTLDYLDSSFYSNPVDPIESIDDPRLKKEEIQVLLAAFFDAYLRNDYEKKGPIYSGFNTVAGYISSSYWGTSIKCTGAGLKTGAGEEFLHLLPHEDDLSSADKMVEYFNNLKFKTSYGYNLVFCGDVWVGFSHTKGLFSKFYVKIQESGYREMIDEIRACIRKAFLSYFESLIMPILNELIASHNNSLADNAKMESLLFVPYRYRGVETLLALAQLFVDGRCSTWEDCMNLFETEEYRKLSIQKIDNIESRLNGIEQKLSTVASQLNDIGKMVGDGLSLVNMQLMSIRKSTGSTAMMSFISMLES